VKGLALFWPFLMECLAFFSNFVGRFWPFLTEGLAFFEKINLAILMQYAAAHAVRAAMKLTVSCYDSRSDV